jgi:hypothetical protein
VDEDPSFNVKIEDGNKKLGEMSCRRKEEHRRKLRRTSYRKTEIEGKAWLLDDPPHLKVQTWKY